MKTVMQVFEQFRAVKGPRLKDRTIDAYHNFLKRGIPDWLDRDLSSITSTEVLERHCALSTAGKSYGPGKCQANHVFRVLSALYVFAREYYALEPVTRDYAKSISNPVDALTVLEKWNKIEPRKSFIDKTQMKIWLKALDTHCDTTARDFYLFILFTGARSTEAADLRWSEVNLVDATATFLQTKNGRDHHIPLTRPVLAILKRRQAESISPYVFARPGEINRAPIARVHEVLEEIFKIKCNPHTLRRTCATYAHRAGVRDEDISRMLNHKKPGVTEHYIQSNPEVLRPMFDIVAKEIAECYEKPRLVLPRYSDPMSA